MSENKSNVRHFNYTKANGQKSVRTAYILHGASENTLAIDLSEFNDSEQAYYEAKIDGLRAKFYEGLREVGLGGNIRTFKDSAMVFFEDVQNNVKMAGRVV